MENNPSKSIELWESLGRIETKLDRLTVSLNGSQQRAGFGYADHGFRSRIILDYRSEGGSWQDSMDLGDGPWPR